MQWNRTEGAWIALVVLVTAGIASGCVAVMGIAAAGATAAHFADNAVKIDHAVKHFSGVNDLRKRADQAGRYDPPAQVVDAKILSLDVWIGDRMDADAERTSSPALAEIGESLHQQFASLCAATKRFQVPSRRVIHDAWKGQTKEASARIEGATLTGTANLDYLKVKDAGGSELDLLQSSWSVEQRTSSTTLECAVTVEIASGPIGLAQGRGVVTIELSAADTATMIKSFRASTTSAAADDQVDRGHIENLLRVALDLAVREALPEIDERVLGVTPRQKDAAAPAAPSR